MALLSVSTILDRVHAINGTIAVTGLAIKTFRYFPTNLANANMPFFCPIVGSAEYNEVTAFRPSTMMYKATRTIEIICVFGDWTEGVYTKSVMEKAEALITAVQETYCDNPFLCLNGVQLENLSEPAYIRSDTGIIGLPRGATPLKAGIIFNLVVRHYLK